MKSLKNIKKITCKSRKEKETTPTKKNEDKL
jgi:hypothetical protein